MIKYLQIVNDCIVGYSDVPQEDWMQYDFNTSNVTFQDFCEGLINGWVLSKGNLIPYQKPQEEVIQESIEELRKKREQLFKQYIDRPLWLEELTEEQKQFVKEWRRTWLDMPQAVENGTWQEPEIPEWFK